MVITLGSQDRVTLPHDDEAQATATDSLLFASWRRVLPDGSVDTASAGVSPSAVRRQVHIATEIARLKAVRENRDAFVKHLHDLMQLAGLTPREVDRVSDAVSETVDQLTSELARSMRPTLERELTTGLIATSLVPTRKEGARS